MRNIWAIAKREILSFFVSPVAYFVIAGFILLAAYFFFNQLAFFNIILQRYASMPYAGAMPAPNINEGVIAGFFQTLLVILVFLVPMLTMRLIADERRNGTFELLVTSPVKISEIVLGKFLGVAFVIIVMTGLASVLPLLLTIYSTPEVPPIFSGILGLMLCALAFASIGMAVSSFTENQIVAAVSGMVVLLLLYVIHAPAESLNEGWAHDVLLYLSPVLQVQDLMKGVISLKSCVYFVSLISLGIFLSFRALESYRWR